MTVSELIKNRLVQLEYEQRDLAAAIEVTPSFISQLLNQKKKLPSPSRTDIYKKIEKFLKLPKGDLSKLAELQRVHELKQKFEHPSVPLFEEVRELVLRKCKSEKTNQLRHIFEKEGFGEMERIVTQKLLDVTKSIVKEEWKNENWVRLVARRNEKSYAQMRTIVLEFLEADIFSLSIQNSTYLLDPLIKDWDIDLVTFHMSVNVNPTLAKEQLRKFAFVEVGDDTPQEDERGLKNFLRNKSLSQGITEEETEFLRRLKFSEKRPTALYYHRELQNLRDPFHFHVPTKRKNKVLQ